LRRPWKNIDKNYAKVKGDIFNFRNDLLPVDFIVWNPEGIDYFGDLGASQSEPILTKVLGELIVSFLQTKEKKKLLLEKNLLELLKES